MLYSPPNGAGAAGPIMAASLLVRDGAAMRLMAAMAEPRPSGPGRDRRPRVVAATRMSPFRAEVAESDARYFRRRAEEEGRAAGAAAGPEARAAHAELAEHYARRSERRTPPSPVTRPGCGRSVAERKRLDDLLDEALLETFPASDPVSIVHVR